MLVLKIFRHCDISCLFQGSNHRTTCVSLISLAMCLFSCPMQEPQPPAALSRSPSAKRVSFSTYPIYVPCPWGIQPFSVFFLDYALHGIPFLAYGFAGFAFYLLFSPSEDGRLYLRRSCQGPPTSRMRGSLSFVQGGPFQLFLPHAPPCPPPPAI